jgi:hypothetical protein
MSTCLLIWWQAQHNSTGAVGVAHTWPALQQRHAMPQGFVCHAQGLQAAFWLWVPLLVAAAQPQRAGFRRRAAILAGADA